MLSGCFEQLPADGSLRCGADPTRPCPANFHCAQNGTCWRNGHEPDLSVVAGDGGFVDDLSVPDGSIGDGGLGDGLMGPVDLQCFNLQCNQMQCDSGTTTVTGVVYTPSGLLRLPNVIVYVPNTTPDPMPTGLTAGSCPACFATVSGSPVTLTRTDASGAFVLQNVPPGDQVPLVIQAGRWRRQVRIPHVAPCTNTVATPDLTRMPQTRFEGDIPQFAIVTEVADTPECLLRTAGISQSEFTVPADPGRVHIYSDNGVSGGGAIVIADGGVDAGAVATTLWDNPAEWLRNDVVVLACEGNMQTKSTSELQNFQGYASVGGRVFVIHYGYVWLQQSEYLPVVTFVNRSIAGNASTPTYVDTSATGGTTLLAWMQANVDGGVPYEQAYFRDDVQALNPPAQQVLYAILPTPSPKPFVQQFAFDTPVAANPSCGHVVYSDFHAYAPSGTWSRFPTECASPVSVGGEDEMIYMLFNQPTCVP